MARCTEPPQRIRMEDVAHDLFRGLSPQQLREDAEIAYEESGRVARLDQPAPAPTPMEVERPPAPPVPTPSPAKAAAGPRRVPPRPQPP